MLRCFPRRFIQVRWKKGLSKNNIAVNHPTKIILKTKEQRQLEEQKRKFERQKRMGLESNYSRYKPYFGSALMASAFLDLVVWAAAGGVGTMMGVVDIYSFKGMVQLFPFHHFIPSEVLRNAFVTCSCSMLWSASLVLFRVPLIGLEAVALSVFVYNRRLNKPKTGAKQKAIGEVITRDIFFFLMWVGFESFAVIVVLTALLTYFEIGLLVQESFPKTISDGVVHMNNTFRYYIGTNDWPTDNFLNSFSIALLFGEIFTIARSRVMVLWKNVAKSLMR